MTGDLEGIGKEDLMSFAASALAEAGLRTRMGNEPFPLPFVYVTCKPIDAVEIIAVIESFYDVEFSQADYDALYELTKRGGIRVDEMTKWLDDCYERRISNERKLQGV